jgi:hypothetical protein
MKPRARLRRCRRDSGLIPHTLPASTGRSCSTPTSRSTSRYMGGNDAIAASRLLGYGSRRCAGKLARTA